MTAQQKQLAAQMQWRREARSQANWLRRKLPSTAKLLARAIRTRE
jgi:hypothetical protein